MRDPQIPARIPAKLISDINKQRKRDGLSWAGLCSWIFQFYIDGRIKFNAALERKHD